MLAGINGALRARGGPVANALGGTVRPWQWRGYDIFATEAGDGPLVLLVHGIYAGSSSYEYRKIFPILSRRYRVVAIDLLGSGLSARPNLHYSAEIFVQQILDAITLFSSEPAAIIASSLGAAYAIRAAARTPGRVRSLVAVCPTGLAGTLDKPQAAAGKLITSVFRAPLIGEALFNVLASRPSLTWFLQNQPYADKRSATKEIVDHYWKLTHLLGARFVPAHFVGQALNCDIADDLRRVASPLLIAWGELAKGPSPLSSAHDYLRHASHAELATFPHSALLPHEEVPQLFADQVERFFER